MRILLIHQYFLEEDDPGGSRFNEMTNQWSESSHEVTVIAGMMHYNGLKKRDEYKGKFIVKKQHEKVQIWRCHVSESYNANFFGRLWAYFSFVLSSLYAGLFKTNENYDVIIVTSPPLFVGITAFLLSKQKRVPYVFEIRDLWPESAIDTGVVSNPILIKFSYWFEKQIYKYASLINVLTPAFRDTLINKKSIPSNKIIFIPNAADFELVECIMSSSFDSQTFKKELGLETYFVITYVGAHGVANHLVQLLDVAEKMQDTNVLFQLIGDGMEKKKLIADAEKRGLNNVKFINPIPKKEIFKYILASDLGTSVLKKVDTFKTIYSNKTFDYMACRKPVLLLIDGVSRQLVEDAVCGLYAEPENSEDIILKIKKYMSDQNLIVNHGENGYQYAKNHFDRKVLAKKYIEYIKDKNLGLKTS